MPLTVELKVKLTLGVDEGATLDMYSVACALEEELQTDTLYVDVMNEETGDDEEQEVSIDNIDITPG